MTPEDYLKKRNNGSLPVYRGELYFPCHRGTYTTQALIKKGNRRAEHVLRVWEMLAAMAAFTGRTAYPAEELESAWKLLLTNQFHDILPGSSIARVYEQARMDIARVRDTAVRGAREALLAFCRNGLGLTVFNPSSHRITRVIRADERFTAGAVTREGVRFQAAAYKDEALVLACLEPMSAVTMYPAEIPVHSTATVRRQGSNYVMQNSVLRAVISKKGELLSMILLQDDQTERREVSMDAEYETEIVCASGLFAELKIITRFSSSVITQWIRLTAEDEQLEFITEADWQERHRLLKVSFDTGIDADNADHQIQFGYLSRPAHRSRQYDADRFEVCAHGWTVLRDAVRGAALLNDCKYGVSVNDGVISLSLLRAPTYPDAAADRGRHRFVYAYRAWDGPLETSGVIEAAEALNDPLITVPGSSVPLRLLNSSDPAVTVESVKLSEDGTGDLVIRLYESMGGTRTVMIHPFLPFSAVCTCSLAEDPQDILPVSDGTFTLSFHPFQIITLRLARKK